MAFRKEHYLYLALVVPVFMILVTVLTVSFFRIELKSDYNFLYAINPGPSEACETQLKSQWKSAETQSLGADCSRLQIYLYDFKTKTSTQLTLEQARRYPLLSGLAQSPDGLVIQPYCLSANGFGWWGGASIDSSLSSICMRKENRQQRLPIELVNEQLGYRKFIFLGWIKDAPQ